MLRHPNYDFFLSSSLYLAFSTSLLRARSSRSRRQFEHRNHRVRRLMGSNSSPQLSLQA